MTFVVADRVQENGTVSSGTGSVSLSGAVLGYQTFASGIGNNNTTYYTIYDPANYTWEVGFGTVTTSPNTLARTTVYANSAGTAPSKISFSTTSSLTVFVTYPAETAVYTNSNAVLNTVTTNSTAFPTATASAGVYSYGTLNYTDTGIWASYQTSVNSYAQMILQNTNAGAAASTDIVVSSDGGTATTNYGNFGINSSGYSAVGSVLNSPGTVYLYSQSTDLAIGTNTSNAIHFVINNQTTDAITINASSAVAFNGQYGSLGQVLISKGSSTPPAWGNAGGNLVTVDFTATAAQTTFTTTYVVGTVSVYRNGIKLGLPDFTATNGTTVVLATGAAAGDLIEIQSFTTLTLYSSITSQDFSGNGSTTVFTLNTNPANSASLLVAINGIVQDPANYTVSGTTLTFTTAPATGTNNISTRTLGVPATTAVSSFSAGTTGFSPTTAATGAVTLSGILAVTNGGTGLSTLGSGYIPYGAGTAALNSSSTFTFDGTTLFSPNASYSGNLTFTGTGSKILGDFSNATLASRTVIQTSTTNGTTGVYVVPNGTSTAASIQALNAATPTNAAKILIATNGTTDVQLVSGINGSASYLPLTFWNSGAEQMRLDTSGRLGIGTNNPTATLTLAAAGTGMVNSSWSTRPGSPAVGQQGYNTTLQSMEFWNGTAWAQYGQASVSSVTYLIVAGGGGGGYFVGGGGGAGGYLTGTQSVSSGTSYTVTVGAGGTGNSSPTPSTAGGNSSFTPVATTAVGGGFGGNDGVAGSGGSGGGGRASGGSGTSGQGNSGGSGVAAPNYQTGGGGGAGAVGANGGANGGNGGNGLSNSISGTATYYAGGGGGGFANGSFTVGSGGLGGGGAAVNGGNGVAGTANTGGGGGANASSTGSSTGSGGNGGSGVVIIAYAQSYKAATTTGSVTITASGGNQIYTFTGSGTITF